MGEAPWPGLAPYWTSRSGSAVASPGMTTMWGDGAPERKWQLDLGAAEALIEAALAQRSADRARSDFVPNAWATVAREVYAWTKAKTYLAAVLCGLVARATDDQANPLSLQVGEDEASHGYAATSLWQAIQGVAQGRIDLRQLKSQPFNNSPFGGKRFLSVDWENVAAFNRPVLARTVHLMETVANMTQPEAAAALRSFLWAVPDARGAHGVKVDLFASRVDLEAFFDSLDAFLLDDGENGRRAQAMVAACLAMVHPDHVDTPRSVNDPSRTLAGDVRVVGQLAGPGRLALFAEAKQKLTSPEWVGALCRGDQGQGTKRRWCVRRLGQREGDCQKPTRGGVARLARRPARDRSPDDDLGQPCRHGQGGPRVVRSRGA